LEAEWVLELVWMFWRIDSSLAPAKIWTPDLPAYILVILLIVLPHTDLKIIQKFVLIRWNGSFGLNVFDWWLEFVEGFCGQGNYELMADRVITVEQRLNLCIFVGCCSYWTNIQNFWFLC
jgi:hypothetical protein